MENKWNEIPIEEFENDTQDLRSDFLKKFNSEEDIKKGEELEILKGCLMLYPDINSDKWKQAVEKLIPDDIVIEYEFEPHITILYGFEDTKVNIERMQELVSIYIQQNPLSIQLGKVSYFRNEERDVVKIGIKDLNGSLYGLNSLIANNFPYQNDFFYSPHMTLGYIKRGEGDRYIDQTIDPDEFGFLTLSTGNFLYSNSNKQKTLITSTIK